jgi:DNA-binding protein HU-beta
MWLSIGEAKESGEVQELSARFRLFFKHGKATHLRSQDSMASAPRKKWTFPPRSLEKSTFAGVSLLRLGVLVVYVRDQPIQLPLWGATHLSTSGGSEVNKGDLVGAVATAANLTNAQAESAVKGMLDAISNTLKSGNSVQIVGFGTFGVGDRAAREGRNPKTGEALMIAASKTVKFSAGKSLKDSVNAALAPKGKKAAAKPAAKAAPAKAAAKAPAKAAKKK